ncbi:hypothetical protein LJR221_001462 [Agrobacterium tumefaciens]
MTIGELEKLAGVNDRTAFWMKFVNDPSVPRDDIYKTAVAELRRLAQERGTLPPQCSPKKKRRKEARP